MGDNATQDVLGLKVSVGLRARSARSMSPEKALRRALVRAADDLWSLPVSVSGIAQDVLDQEETIAALPADHLLVLLDGPEGALAVVTCDRALVTALVEIQTISVVTDLPPEDRPFTATEASMTETLLSAALGRFCENLEDHPLLAQVQGYRFGAKVDDPRSIEVQLKAPEYRRFQAELDLALGKRQGHLTIYFPQEPEQEQAEQQSEPSSCGAPNAEQLMLVPTQLDVRLTGLRIGLAQARALQPGSVLPLAPEELNRAQLVTTSGHCVSKGRLGRMDGLRAFRVEWPATGQAGREVGIQGLSELIEAAGPIDESPSPGAEPDPPAENAPPAIDALPDLPPLSMDQDEGDGLPPLGQGMGDDGASTDQDAPGDLPLPGGMGTDGLPSLD